MKLLFEIGEAIWPAVKLALALGLIACFLQREPKTWPTKAEARVANFLWLVMIYLPACWMLLDFLR